MLTFTHPLLTCESARALEAARFGGDETKEWPAMQEAGRRIAGAVEADFEEIGGFPARAQIVVLVGKGHNGGDALLATHAWLVRHPGATAQVHFALGERSLRPLTTRAWRELTAFAGARATVIGRHQLPASADLCVDGVFGFQFRPPAPPLVAELLAEVNACSFRLRAAVDLPSAGLFRADFTYATGIVKGPAALAPGAGRLRYLDLGFFAGDEPAGNRVLTYRILEPLAGLRPARCDKRSFGHVFILGGSRQFPGAVLMSVLAALRSGAGLVTAFVPESVVASFAARAPEAMWVGWPETPEGGLALEGEHLLRERLERATALVIGPGLGRERETLALVRNLVETVTVPLVLDADALQPEIVAAGNALRVLTPHAGEFARISGGLELGEFVRGKRTTVVLKGAVTQIAGGGAEEVYHSFFGGPVLARGGSGDVLAGLVGGQLAQIPTEPLLAAARAVVWHGRAADLLARACGSTAVTVVQLLDFLSAALRESVDEQ
jgi:NAD(P)H-hydrate epimerase